MSRSFYSASMSTFFYADTLAVLGELVKNSPFSLDDLQRNAWVHQIAVLKKIAPQFIDGHLFFEFSVPRIGKRIDNILLYRGSVFILEFKVGERDFHRRHVEQVYDYALDLKYFHEGSRNRAIVPILIATNAAAKPFETTSHDDHVFVPLLCNSRTLSEVISHISTLQPASEIDAAAWESARYAPTPTIIEAAQALYGGHNVVEISRSDAAAVNLSATNEAISHIIDECKRTGTKAICFVTGVPGAGKTLAGLNIANQRHSFQEEEHAVFLSGNGPLVKVLCEALARNDRQRLGSKMGEARRKASAFIQNIHHFRDDALETRLPPIERVVIFDEAQRAWTKEQTSKFMKEKKGKIGFDRSEPEFLIEVMDRHSGWAVLVCLVGEGQEINTGEAGLSEWFRALRERFRNWRVFLSSQAREQYTHAEELQVESASRLNYSEVAELHLAVSIRSFRSERLSELIQEILEGDLARAHRLVAEIGESYPIKLTRNLSAAKEWVRSSARGSERYGLTASSRAYRLRPYGIWVSSAVDPEIWFLNDRDDVRSSFALEATATEFDIQGLELDWTIVAWDGDLRYVGESWTHRKFVGTQWQHIRKKEDVVYLTNSYRVLLTRARQGMVIFVPEGNDLDPTSRREYYDGTYNFLQEIGLSVLGDS